MFNGRKIKTDIIHMWLENVFACAGSCTFLPGFIGCCIKHNTFILKFYLFSSYHMVNTIDAQYYSFYYKPHVLSLD